METVVNKLLLSTALSTGNHDGSDAADPYGMHHHSLAPYA